MAKSWLLLVMVSRILVSFSEDTRLIAALFEDGLIILWVASDLPPSNFGEESAEELGDKEYWRDKRAIKYVFPSFIDSLSYADPFSLSPRLLSSPPSQRNEAGNLRYRLESRWKVHYRRKYR